MTAQDLSSIRIAMKAQSGVGTPASGSGAVELQLLPSQGFQQQIAEVLSELLDTTRMAGRPRQGSKFYNWAGETELLVGGQDVQLQAVLGGTWAPAVTLDQTDLTSVVISGTGTVITFGGGSAITEGLRAGMMASFAGLATAGNNGVPFPVLSISSNGRVLTIPSGYLVDETIDSAFSFIIARSLVTATPYTDRVFTVEHRLAQLGRSLVGENFRFNMLSIDVQPNKRVKISLGMGGTLLDLKPAAAAIFTAPTLVEGESLDLIDGGIYVGSSKRVNLSAFGMKLEAPVSGVPLIGTNDSPDAFLGQYKLTGSQSGIIEDGDDFDSFSAEDVASIILHCKEQSTQNFVTIAAMNAAFGGWSMPAGGEGPAIQTVPLNAGKDKRGDALGYAPTTFVISTSAS
jgi:hypothetical protein